MAANARSLDGATLSEPERRAVLRLAELLPERLGDRVHALWLYGSRARGEQPGPERDIDLLVVSDGGIRDLDALGRIAEEAAEAEGVSPVYLSLNPYSPEELEQRRRIRSFFIQEVDRDKIVLFEKL